MVTAVYTLDSLAATGIELVLQIITVRSLRGLLVRGSIRWGKVFRVSTTSPARSPQAAIITTSTSAWRLVNCCKTVFPAPNGPGMQYVPPRATGKRESIRRILVTSGVVGFNFSAYALIAIFTGQDCFIKTSIGLPELSFSFAIGSFRLYFPFFSMLTIS